MFNPNILREHFEEIDSTQSYSKGKTDRLTPGQWFLVTANKQTKGRGTHNRTWTSPPGNIYATFSLIVPKSVMRFFFNIPQVTALSVAQTIKAFDERLFPQIKWVNDVLLNGKKVSGILCESTQRKEWCVLHIGIGMNVNTSKEVFEHIDQPATSLMIERNQGQIDKEIILISFQRKLYKNITTLFKQGFDVLHPLIDDLMAFKGERILFDKEDGTDHSIFETILEGIDRQGQLLLRDLEHPCLSGRILRRLGIRRTSKK